MRLDGADGLLAARTDLRRVALEVGADHGDDLRRTRRFSAAAQTVLDAASALRRS
jgi:hypothetical protein